jgi:hypothetical protein
LEHLRAEAVVRVFVRVAACRLVLPGASHQLAALALFPIGDR